MFKSMLNVPVNNFSDLSRLSYVEPVMSGESTLSCPRIHHSVSFEAQGDQSPVDPPKRENKHKTKQTKEKQLLHAQEKHNT